MAGLVIASSGSIKVNNFNLHGADSDTRIELSNKDGIKCLIPVTNEPSNYMMDSLRGGGKMQVDLTWGTRDNEQEVTINAMMHIEGADKPEAILYVVAKLGSATRHDEVIYLDNDTSGAVDKIISLNMQSAMDELLQSVVEMDEELQRSVA